MTHANRRRRKASTPKPRTSVPGGTVRDCLTRQMFVDRYSDVFKGPKEWQAIGGDDSGATYNWSDSSTYIQNPPFFDQMKDGVVLVNCARGGTVDENALLKALESGKVAAAGLDVFENEPTPRKELLEHPRVSLTPHIGASTMQAQANIGKELADQLIAFFG